MLSTRDYLILFITNTSHKVHLLNCALRCSSKLQKIQNLENFVSMAIQGTQELMCTKHTLFLYFSVFSIFFFLNFYKKQNKAKNWKQTNKKMLNKEMYKTRCKCMRKEEKEKRSLHGDYTMFWYMNSNCMLSRGLVNKSTFWLLVWMNSRVSVPSSTISQMKWCWISICFVRECWIGFDRPQTEWPLVIEID